MTEISYRWPQPPQTLQLIRQLGAICSVTGELIDGSVDLVGQVPLSGKQSLKVDLRGSEEARDFSPAQTKSRYALLSTPFESGGAAENDKEET